MATRRLTARRIDAIRQAVGTHYLDSHDFNGLLLSDLAHQAALTDSQFTEGLTTLIRDGSISLNFGDLHPNPHIQAFPPDDPEVQISTLREHDLTYVCAYPTADYLRTIVDRSVYEGRPFTLRLALGEPQLSFESFDLSVLEFYRNDPRYYYLNNDIDGSIFVKDEFFESRDMEERDHVVLQSFGFAYDDNLNRALAVFLRYLADLPPEHQQIWNARTLRGDYKLHPSYFESSTQGEWWTKQPICDALLAEQCVINDMCQLMGRPPLFRTVWKDKRPEGFGFLVRPTRREFEQFTLILDKLIADNLNREFFRDDVPLEREVTRRDGRIQVEQKNTIKLLDEWLDKKNGEWRTLNR